MKPTSAFKFKKEYKCFVASIADREKRNYMKNVFIQAQLSEEEAKKKSLKGKDKE